ncbi:MAG: ATP-dependent Clp protease proteolytic subunit [Ruminiclostridium sp.]|nr:ATP-dependent Clp protease proteolytic subunit [Ruminiclostridium sp.]
MLPTIIITDKQGLHPYDLYSKTFESDRKIYFFDEVNSKSAYELILQLEYLDKISDDDITIYINSPGGAVNDGYAIVDAMERCRSDIRTVCTGLAASFGSVILTCGTKGKRFVTPNAEVMIHQPLGGARGQASDIERATRHILHIKEVLMKLLADRTGQSVEKITNDCDRDTYLSAEEAVSYGLVDGILTENE